VENPRFRMKRRSLLLWAGLSPVLAPLIAREARAFGQEGAFHPRLMLTGAQKVDAARRSAPSRWSWEVIRRTSSPARLVVDQIMADSSDVLHEPFLVWVGDGNIPALTPPELRRLRQYFELGGLLYVDDSNPKEGSFGRAARREIQRVLPEASIVQLDSRHVLFKSYYLLDGPAGRVTGPSHLDAIIRGRDAQVLFASHDLLGALARDDSGTWTFDIEGGASEREMALRFAVNIAMYSLCSDYKDDQVHAQELMRRRGRRQQ